MDDRQLDERLRLAGKEAERFFANWRFAPLRQVVQRRAAARPPRGYPYPRALGLAMAAAMVILILIARPLGRGLTRGSSPGTPLVQQAIQLDDRVPSQRLSYFRLRQPEAAENSLLAVIWASQPRGGWQAIYSDLLGGEGEPLPAASLALPGSHRYLVLISSRDHGQEYLNYRVLGSDGNQIYTFRKQELVPRGSLEVHQGILVERRAIPEPNWPGAQAPSSGGLPAMQVTNLVPYLEENGEIYLPGGYLQLEVGQFIELMGNGGGRRIRAFSREGILQDLQQKFFATRPGEDFLILAPDGNTARTRQLPVKVVEP